MHLAQEVTTGFFFLAPWLVFAPLIGLLINLIFGKWFSETVIGTVASLASGAAFVVSVLLAYSLSANHGEVVRWQLAEWIHIGALELDWTFRINGLSGPTRFGLARAPQGWWLKEVRIGGRNAAYEPAPVTDRTQIRCWKACGARVDRAAGGCGVERPVHHGLRAGRDHRRSPDGAGAPAPCSEDTDVWYQLLRCWHTIHYTPRAIVNHHHRSSPEELRKQIYAYAKGHAAYMTQIVNKLLHLPTVRMKQAAAAADGVVYADVVRHLFGLEEEERRR